MIKFALAIWAGVSLPALGNAYRKLVLDPPRFEKLASGTCHAVTLKLLNADGEGAIAEREKIIELSSDFPTTIFYSHFDPPCTDGMKTQTVSLVPGKSVVKFFFRDDLNQHPDAAKKGVPHTITITASSRGATPSSTVADIRSADCAIGCRDTRIKNRVACTKKCPPATDAQVGGADKRKCWSDCFVEEEEGFLQCQKLDLSYAAGECGTGCQTFCEYFYGDCYGKCYFHKDARNTSFGAKCVDECMKTRDKCRAGGCSASAAPESDEPIR